MIQNTQVNGTAGDIAEVVSTGVATGVASDLEKFVVQEFAKFLAAIVNKFGHNSISNSSIAGNVDHGGAQLTTSVNVIARPAGSNDTPAPTVVTPTPVTTNPVPPVTPTGPVLVPSTPTPPAAS